MRIPQIDTILQRCNTIIKYSDGLTVDDIKRYTHEIGEMTLQLELMLKQLMTCQTSYLENIEAERSGLNE